MFISMTPHSVNDSASSAGFPKEQGLVPPQGASAPSRGDLVPSRGDLVPSRGDLVPSRGDLGPSAARRSGGRSIAPQVLFARLQAGLPCRVVDVRSPAEYAGERLRGSESIPLDGPGLTGNLDPAGWGGEVYLLCQGGVRAARAAQRLAEFGVQGVVVEGGLNAWKSEGLPVEQGGGRMLPVMQQTQLVIGTMCAGGAALALGGYPVFAWIPFVMGLGLIFAGLTGSCGLALLLARMPWNQRGAGSTSGSEPRAVGASCCSVSPGGPKAGR
jgi:rhodanese-related sulfurtransferase